MNTELQDHTQARAEPHIFAQTQRPKPNGQKDPAGEVGWFFEREREKYGVSIEEAGDATGIHPYHIEAIELGDLTHMPPRMEALEMIAAYAQYLGFDAEPLVQHMASFMPPPPVVRKNFHPANPPVLSSAKVLRFGQMPKLPKLNIRLSNFPGGTSGIIASAFAAFMVFAAANWMLSPGNGRVDATQQIAQATPTVDPMATASTGTDAADVKVTDTPMLGAGAIANAPDLPAADANVATGEDPDAIGAFIQQQLPSPKAVTAPKKLVQVASVGPKQTSDGQIYGADNADARIVLKATAPVWLRIEDATGNVLITQMLGTGDIYRVPNRDGLIALSRDGGRLSYVIDGKQKGVLGPPGKILVGEKLDVAALASRT